MSLPPPKQLFINFMVKLLLIFAIIIGGIALFFYNTENTSYFLQKQQRIAKLLALSDALLQTKQSYFVFAGSNGSQSESLASNLKILAERKKVLQELTVANEGNENEANAVKASLNDEERFYTAQLDLLAGQSLPLPLNTVNKSMGNTQPLLFQLIKLEQEHLSLKMTQNDAFYTMLGYMVVGIAFLVMLMNIVLYLRSQKALQKQLLHEKEIYNAKLVAQSANNAKSEYLAMISHEIRTPMNGVLGMSNLLLQGSLNEEHREYAKTIHDSAESLLRIVNDVLDFSRIEAGKIQLDKVAVNVKSLLAETFAILPKPSDQLEISYQIDPSVPQFIYCDGVRLKQILFNLLGNAIKFTEKGAISLECKVIDKDEHGFIRLGFKVKDTGIGIAEDRIKLLFKPFVQVDHTTVRKYGGTGLGLNIAYNLISMMDGKIKVSSEVGNGSTFTFFILTKEMAQNAVVKPLVAQEQQVLDGDLSTNFPLKVLVVDDNEINLMLITKTLSKLGYRCKKASNGQLALDLVKQEEFDLIFMDMQMPIMDGTVATTEIRKYYRIYEYPVVVALTANALGDGKDKCLEAGMQDFIAKPFKPAEIEEVIKKWAPKIIDYKGKNESISLS